MKLIAVLLTACCLQVSARSGAQVSFSGKDVRLDVVFQAIGKQTGYIFLYSPADLKDTKPVTIDVKNVSIETIMKKCLEGQPLEFTIADKTVFVKRVKQKTNTIEAFQNVNTPLIDVRGRVINKAREPLSGANVVIKRTGKGTISDANGEFYLKKLYPDDIIVVSYIGYKQQTSAISGQSTPLVIMEIADNSLDEAIVQAYGYTSQRYNTGNIAKLTSVEIEKQPIGNPLQALQGRVPGLFITQTSGYATAPFRVELRGRSTIGGQFVSDPLYIIDGVPLAINDIDGGANYESGSRGFLQNGMAVPGNGQSPLFSINPRDIESIEVLKDADATAIYGSRGANGVIIITTKKGASGKTKMEFNVYSGINKVTRKWEMLNTSQYISIRKEAFANDGLIPDITNAPDLIAWDTTRFTDWQKFLWDGVGKTTDAQLSLSGGDSRTSFRIGAGYRRQTDITSLKGADQRASLQLNVNHKTLNEKFSTRLNVSYSFAQSDMVWMPAAADLPPNAPSVYNENGKLNYEGWAPATDLFRFAELLQQYTSKTNFINANLVINYRLLKGLNIRSSFGYNSALIRQEYLIPISSQDPALNPTGSAQFGNNNTNNWIIEPQLEYATFIGKSRINILAGSTFQANYTSGLFTIGSGYTNDGLLRTISNAPEKNAFENFGQYKYAALFGRINYNHINKYIINISARRDGSSRFGPGKQFGNFASIGAAWIFSNENFIKNNLSFLSFGKLRASYGTTGSDAVGDYQYLTRWGSRDANRNNVFPYQGIPGYVPTQHYNPTYQWQENKKLELAIEMGLFEDRISATAAWYRNRCDNQLVSFPLANFTGFPSVIANSPANVENTGMEFVLGIKIFSKSEFNWNISFNSSFNKNKLLSYPNLHLSPYAGLYVVGQPLNVLKRLHFIGVDPQSGLYSFEDKNKDGNISFEDDAFFDTYYYATPKFAMGWSNSISYKDWQLDAFFHIVDKMAENPLYASGFAGTIRNQPITISKRWQNPGDVSEIAKLSTIPDATYANITISNAIYSNAFYIRLQNLSISYGLPNKFLSKAGLKSMRFYLLGQNLFLITNYKGLDPEIGTFGTMPIQKTFTAGIQLSL